MAELAAGRLPEEDHTGIVEDRSGGPRSVAGREEDWELDVSGYSQLLGRPIVSGWRRRDLKDQAADLDCVEYEVTYVGAIAPRGRSNLYVFERAIGASVGGDADSDSGGGPEFGADDRPFLGTE